MQNKYNHILVSLILLSCSTPKMEHPIEKFLADKNYKFSNQKADIPNTVLLSMMEKEENTLKLADLNKFDSLCFTDDCNVGFYYNAKLNFVLYSKSKYLISYTKGGVGVRGVISYFNLEGKLISLSKNVVPPIEDTNNLLNRIFPHLSLGLYTEDKKH